MLFAIMFVILRIKAFTLQSLRGCYSTGKGRRAPIRFDRWPAIRRRFRHFALVRHNCFRPSSRLRQHDIVSFRYFRFQAHRSMSALPPLRDLAVSSLLLTQPLPVSFFSFASRFERAALRRWMRSATVCRFSIESRACTRCFRTPSD